MFSFKNSLTCFTFIFIHDIVIYCVVGEHAEAEEEDDDIDMDQIPDEEMNKLDEKLAMAFKALGIVGG